jgi:RNA polymerase sigma-70 factor (ECF subfamily)
MSPEFLQRFRAGDPAALEELYLAHVDDVARIIRQVMPRNVNGSDLEDLLHEVFLRAFSENARRSFDGVRDYAPYLATMTRNLVIDWTHQRSRESPAADADFAWQIAAPPPDSERPWTDPATVAVVNRYLAHVSQELRDVHEQRYVLCRSQESVCQILGLTRQQLRTREKRLRDGLAREVSRAKLREEMVRRQESDTVRKINQNARQTVDSSRT